MALYKYKARNQSGTLTEGNLTAETKSRAAVQLANRDLTVVSLTEVEQKSDVMEDINTWIALKSLKPDDLILFSRQMYSLTKAGVPIIRAIRSLVESTRNQALIEALKDISQSLEGGLSLSQAMHKHPKIFSVLYTSIINVGESAGSLDQGF